jgi:hypothetical protein
MVSTKLQMSTHSSLVKFCKCQKKEKVVHMRSSLDDNKLNIASGRKFHIYHEASPLFNTKMLKAQPIAKLVNSNLTCNTWRKPLAMNCCIMNAIQGCCILVMVAKGLVLISKFKFDQLFVPIQQLSPVE